MLVIVIVIVVATVGVGMFLQHLRDFEENGRLKGLEGWNETHVWPFWLLLFGALTSVLFAFLSIVDAWSNEKLGLYLI